jgi:hypothetical protein
MVGSWRFLGSFVGSVVLYIILLVFYSPRVASEVIVCPRIVRTRRDDG